MGNLIINTFGGPLEEIELYKFVQLIKVELMNPELKLKEVKYREWVNGNELEHVCDLIPYNSKVNQLSAELRSNRAIQRIKINSGDLHHILEEGAVKSVEQFGAPTHFIKLTHNLIVVLSSSREVMQFACSVNLEELRIYSALLVLKPQNIVVVEFDPSAQEEK